MSNATIRKEALKENPSKRWTRVPRSYSLRCKSIGCAFKMGPFDASQKDNMLVLAVEHTLKTTGPAHAVEVHESKVVKVVDPAEIRRNLNPNRTA